jgi:hypothetical protein
MKPGPKARPIEERFWENVEKTDMCWLWIGAKAKNGYGVLQNRIKGKLETAHRISWQLHFGPIPANLFVCHHCDVRHCVNPKHLFLGTARHNIKDASLKGRLNGRNVGRGERQGSHKLTEDNVRLIRDMKGSYRAIARQFDISHQAVSYIKRRQWWKHLV